MSPEENKLIATLKDRLHGPIHIQLRTSADARSKSLERFSDELARQVPQIRLTHEKADEADATPGFLITSSILYQAVPHGTELRPFLDMLIDISKQYLEDKHEEPVGESEIPATLKLYVSGMCAFCPAMVKKVVSLVRQCTNVHLTIIDGMLFAELAEKDHIRSVPTLILDDQFRWTGSVAREEVLATIQHRDPAELSATTLAAMISEGNAYQLSDMMLKQACIFPAFIDLLIHEAFSTRLGAMAAAEEIAENQPALASQMATLLVERFESQSDAVKGDMLYIVGVSGDHQFIGFLKGVASGPYDESVQEAAVEAIEALQSN